MSSKLSSTERLAAQKEKLKEKMDVINDKKECETTIATSNLGWELARAIAGLEANRSHLATADRLLQQYNEKEASKETLLTSATIKRDNAIAAANAAFELATTKRDNAISAANAAYRLTADKTDGKLSQEYSLLSDRVKRFEAAVKLSEENVKRLQDNKPKGLVRVEFAAKKLERGLGFIDDVDAMNKKQEQDRDAYMAKMVPKHMEIDPVHNMPKWLVDIGEDKSTEMLRIEAHKQEEERKRKELQDQEDRKEEASKQRRIALALEEQRLSNDRKLELQGREAGLADDEVFRLKAEANKKVQDAADKKELEDFRKRDAEDERRYREQHKDEDGDDITFTEEELREAKERQRSLLHKNIAQDRYVEQTPDRPRIITNTKKPIKTVQRY